LLIPVTCLVFFAFILLGALGASYFLDYFLPDFGSLDYFFAFSGFYAYIFTVELGYFASGGLATSFIFRIFLSATFTSS
jgi:hypothetical protein